MAESIQTPEQARSLLTRSGEKGYSTMRPKLRLIIPPYRGPMPKQITLGSAMSASSDVSEYASALTAICTTCDGISYCAFCLEEGTTPDMAAQHA
ncbi:hypothetical protein GGS21DRAFT_519892 [Xylaria nigripes]|nr:hypothetical protein GGS21DRAFT_519892 [Xylaria nigripes]